MITLQDIQDRYSRGERLSYVFFYGHYRVDDNRSVFSQWWEYNPFIVDDIEYQTAEHWMMAEKARLFNDGPILNEILKVNSPREAKRYGRSVSNFNSTIWDNNKFDIVVEGNYQKFSQHDDLKNFLLSTGDKILVEASPYDKIWGIGMDKQNPLRFNPYQWKGENLLGFALMEVRKQLKNE